MFFCQLELGTLQNFHYLLGCEKTKECAVIDCAYEIDVLQKEAEENGYRITKIFLTHFHYDHSGAAEELAQKTGAEIFGHVRGSIKTTSQNWVIPPHFTHLHDGDIVSIGNIEGKCISTPGHQSDHMCYIFEEKFFTGDTLFIEGIGRVDFPDSSPQDMKNTVELLKTLSDDLIVYPGHNYGPVSFRSLGEEKELNPYLNGELVRW